MKIEINHESPIPLHVQVEELLRKLLNLEEYRNGAFLPKEVELSNRLGVSRNTIRQATNKLEQEGLIVRKKGVGSWAAGKKPLYTGLNHWYSFTNEMKEKGIDVLNLSLNVSWVRADKKLASVLNIDLGRDVLKLTKLKGTKKSMQPIVFFESYFHPRIGVNEKDEFNIPLYTMLEKKYGVVAVKSSENISAITAGKMAGKLEVKTSDPVLFRERVVMDAGDRPIEYNLGYYRSDSFIYSIIINKA